MCLRSNNLIMDGKIFPWICILYFIGVTEAGTKNLTVYRITPRNYTGIVSFYYIGQNLPDSIIKLLIKCLPCMYPQTNLDTGDAGTLALSLLLLLLLVVVVVVVVVWVCVSVCMCVVHLRWSSHWRHRMSPWTNEPAGDAFFGLYEKVCSGCCRSIQLPSINSLRTVARISCKLMHPTCHITALYSDGASHMQFESDWAVKYHVSKRSSVANSRI